MDLAINPFGQNTANDAHARSAWRGRDHGVHHVNQVSRDLAAQLYKVLIDHHSPEKKKNPMAQATGQTPLRTEETIGEAHQAAAFGASSALLVGCVNSPNLNAAPRTAFSCRVVSSSGHCETADGEIASARAVAVTVPPNRDRACFLSMRRA